MVLASTPKYVYFDARPLGPYGFLGNVPRLFMRTNGIPFDERLVTFAEWGAGEKARTAESLEQPAGKLPVLHIGDRSYPESLAIARMMAREAGLYGKDSQLDFEVDAVADAQRGWRDAWNLSFRDAADSVKLKKYLSERDGHYKMLNGYYERRSAKDSPYIVKGDKPSFADIAVWNLIRDDQLTHGKIDLSKWRNLQAVYEAVGSIPEVQQWVSDCEASAEKPTKYY